MDENSQGSSYPSCLLGQQKKKKKKMMMMIVKTALGEDLSYFTFGSVLLIIQILVSKTVFAHSIHKMNILLFLDITP
jgi:hypothetical protein